LGKFFFDDAKRVELGFFNFLMAGFYSSIAVQIFTGSRNSGIPVLFRLGGDTRELSVSTLANLMAIEVLFLMKPTSIKCDF